MRALTATLLSCAVLNAVIFAVMSHIVTETRASYDYIVVGAGSAGSVVASRLSEDRDVTVLLIEQGADYRNYTDINVPGLTHKVWTLPNILKTYSSEPRGEKYKSLKNGTLKFKAATALGGTSLIYGLGYFRGDRQDYERWYRHTGDVGWRYSHVMPYFRKIEQVMNPELVGSVYRGTTGQIPVTRTNSLYPLTDKLIQAAIESGYQFNEDFNGEKLEGVSRTQCNIKEGERWGSARVYLYPALTRPNLDVLLNARAEKILFHAGQVVGVHVVSGRTLQVNVTKEVVVSAGVFGSPKLLLLSGVGPRKHLEEMKIPVVSDLPVGENLQDHVLFDLAVAVNETLVPPKVLSLPWVGEMYRVLKQGPLAVSDAGVHLHVSTGGEDWPDVKVAFRFSVATTAAMLNDYDPQTVTDLARRDNVTNGFTMLLMATRPSSSSLLRLRSDQPDDDVIVHLNYHDKPEDAQTLVRAVRVCQKLLHTPAMAEIGATLVDTTRLTVCKEHEYDSDNYWACAVKARPLSYYHQVGTCKMGPGGDPTSVVDSQLRVRGVRGVRVADASVMPFITTANTYAATVMIGEKVVDLIKGKSLPPFTEGNNGMSCFRLNMSLCLMCAMCLMVGVVF
ncbi:alcohol dehydrogenase [acceptor]-like [Physella acuta]|uniref:alcohol dehydrogenase [acceptor]-like n=1 Tax=Physella acuta TaxID=109671 RepID=UPI0027DD5F66|nr:alcohol dehydrogenase [acceptor]-like [Physella acuta]XP_059146674.1 alcohol dehydrogenase [acceptor]-like [Physella acuta]